MIGREGRMERRCGCDHCRGSSHVVSRHSPYGIQMFLVCTARRRNSRPSPARGSIHSRGVHSDHVRLRFAGGGALHHRRALLGSPHTRPRPRRRAPPGSLASASANTGHEIHCARRHVGRLQHAVEVRRRQRIALRRGRRRPGCRWRAAARSATRAPATGTDRGTPRRRRRSARASPARRRAAARRAPRRRACPPTPRR
jgi:hypothetical protein